MSVEVRGVVKRYGGVEALGGVSFEVFEGEVFGLVGPNAAGKTTLMRILATVLVPDSGTVLVGGYDAVRESLRVRRIIGVLTEDFGRGFWWRLTAWENLLFYARVYGAGREMVDRVLEYFQLSEYRDVRFQRLSKGLRKRLALARALVGDPKVLLLDEPESSLDQEFRERLRSMVRERFGGDRTIVMATHSSSLAGECDRVARIKSGRILEIVHR